MIVFCIKKYTVSLTDVVLFSYKPWDEISILIYYNLFRFLGLFDIIIYHPFNSNEFFLTIVSKQ